MAKYDLENLIDDIESHLQSYLPAQISDMNTEKNDGIVLDSILNEAMFLYSMGDQMNSVDPFLLIAPGTSPEAIGQGPQLAVKYLIDIVIVKADPGTDPQIFRRLMRYQRVLSDLFQKTWSQLGHMVEFKVHGILPTPVFALQSEDYPVRAVGVTLETMIVY